MRTRSLAAALALILAGCTQHDAGSGDFGAISVIGTPILLGLKAGACAATVVIAAPVSALATLTRPTTELGATNTDFDFNVQIRDELDDGVVQNCGPPYVVAR
jgi:hypothetical protein